MTNNIYKTYQLKNNMQKRNKKAAIELSINTIVIIVLAMSMLILGLVLVKNIFDSAKYNVDGINDKVKDEINKLFSDDIKSVVYLDNTGAKIKQGEQYGIAWGIQNTGKSQKFSWTTEVQDSSIQQKCGVTDKEALAWVSTGEKGDVELTSGDKYQDVLFFNIPEGSVSDISSCVVRFRLVIKQADGSAYSTLPFNVNVN